MHKSSIENVKMEPQLNSEPQPIVSTSPPAIGNTNVICCSGLYDKAILYAKWLVGTYKSNIEAMDVVHDVILKDSISFENFRQKIKGYFLESIRLKCATEISPFFKKRSVDFYVCKHCQEQLAESAFRITYLKNGLQKTCSYCRKCEVKLATDRRKRRDAGQLLTSSQKYYRKKKQCKEFMEKRRIASRLFMREYRRLKKSA